MVNRIDNLIEIVIRQDWENYEGQQLNKIVRFDNMNKIDNFTSLARLRKKYF